MDTSLPSMRTVPELLCRKPNNVSMVSERPAPISPATPRISPRWTVKLTSRITPGHVRFETSSNTSPLATSRLG